jgi:(E)-4-hydroxy-3-methylbut-2-enyl-diphosphate synthase
VGANNSPRWATDRGLWCGPNYANLKRGGEPLGQFPYDAILAKLKSEFDALIAAKF